MINKKTKWPLIMSIFVLVFSPLVALLANNLTLYSLILVVPMALFWWLTKVSRKEIGLRFTKSRYFIIAILYPIIIQSIIGGIALFLGVANLNSLSLTTIALALVVDVSITSLLLLITEEGVFRGVLWAILEKRGYNAKTILIWTSLLFSLWHIPVLTLFQEFQVTGTSLMFYLINAFVVGMIWAKLREKSGSIIPLVISHAVWNTLAYVLFGYGKNAQMLGISQANIQIFDPERGILGVILNIAGLLFIFYLFSKTKSKKILNL